MGNLKNYNFNKIDLRLSNSEYYDFWLAQDESCISIFTGVSEGCMAVHYDFNNPDIYLGGYPYNSVYLNQYGYDTEKTIYSLSSWSGATNSGYTFTTFGLTALDNGYVTVDIPSGDTANTTLLSAFTGTNIVNSGFTQLVIHEVTGHTGNYEYPIEQRFDGGTAGDYVRLCGGFYQGYYKLDGYTYQTLPVRMNKAWAAEFWLRPSDSSCSGVTATTLNDTYPNNKGFFFYMGTRAENKFWNQFEGNNTGTTSGCTSGATQFCTIPKESDVTILDPESGFGIPLNPPAVQLTEITNNFLIYNRGKNGKLAGQWTGDSIWVSAYTETVTDDRNPFLVYTRAGSSCGTGDTAAVTAGNFSGFTAPQTELDKDLDTYDNALGFRIKDDGSIGYRLLTYQCTGTTSGVTVEEAYSVSGMVNSDKWNHIAIRFVANETYDDCELTWKDPRKGKLMFYVNGYLKFVVDDFDEFVARRLNEYKDKQLGVPFNISLGGGTQGLLENMTFDGPDAGDLGLDIEQNFAGSFIGDLSQFRFHTCDLKWCDIKNNFEQEKSRYGH